MTLLPRTFVFAATLLIAGVTMGISQVQQLQQKQQPSAATFKIDAGHSAALFRVMHVGAGQFWGRFNSMEGTFTFAEGSEKELSFDVTIPIASIDTNSEDRNKHLLSPDFFNAKEYPEMTFKSTFAKKMGEQMFAVTGELTLHGITKTITTNIEWTGSNDAGPRYGYRCGFEAKFTIKRSEYDVAYGVKAGMLGDEVSLIIAIEGQRE